MVAYHVDDDIANDALRNLEWPTRAYVVLSPGRKRAIPG
jgi:hypothetical protein